MKSSPPNDISGSVLVFAVLLLTVGAFVLAGIAQLAATQALVGENEWEMVNRHIRLDNSRAMARQYVMQRMFIGPITNDVSYTDGSGYGGFQISEAPGTDNYWTTLSTTNTNVNLKINPFTLMERGGFYRVVIGGTITDGVDDIAWNFQVRTRSPIAAGYPVVQHKPANANLSGLVGDSPYVDMNNAEQIIGFHEMARMRVSSVTNTNSSDTTGYVGYLDAPTGVASFAPFTAATMSPFETDTNGVATNLQAVVNLGSTDPNDTSQVLVYLVPSQAEYFETNAIPAITNTLPVVSVRLIGTSIYGLKPLQIIIPSSNTNAQQIELVGNNPADTGRVTYLNYRRDTSNPGELQVVTTNATGTWRLGITTSHSDIGFDGPIDIVGGVRTDGFINGSPTLHQELNPGGLDYIADRMMWLEDYKTP